MDVRQKTSSRTIGTLHPGYWMRSVQFAGLHRILHRIAGFREGIRVKELNQVIIDNRDY